MIQMMKVISVHERTVRIQNAVVRFSEVINEGLQANNLQVSDIDMLIRIKRTYVFSLKFIQKRNSI
jgi:3-oxoacyl-[acyl-carrier-protein] synthase III